MVSHRSGETEDHYIADFAVGLRTGQVGLDGQSAGMLGYSSIAFHSADQNGRPMPQ